MLIGCICRPSPLTRLPALPSPQGGVGAAGLALHTCAMGPSSAPGARAGGGLEQLLSRTVQPSEVGGGWRVGLLKVRRCTLFCLSKVIIFLKMSCRGFGVSAQWREGGTGGEARNGCRGWTRHPEGSRPAGGPGAPVLGVWKQVSSQSREKARVRKSINFGTWGSVVLAQQKLLFVLWNCFMIFGRRVQVLLGLLRPQRAGGSCLPCCVVCVWRASGLVFSSPLFCVPFLLIWEHVVVKCWCTCSPFGSEVLLHFSLCYFLETICVEENKQKTT